MLESLILDALIILILLLLAALGAHRGGLREMCTAAGLLLGVAIASEWTLTWGNWIAKKADINQDAARFSVAVATLVVSTMVCGYGAGAAFAYRPGPGGRIYGAILGLITGVVFVGYVINYVRTYLRDGDFPKIVRDGYVAKAFSERLDWVLLIVAAVIVLATAFGLFVREDEAEPQPIPQPPPFQASMRPAAIESPQPRPQPAAEPMPATVETVSAEQPTASEPALYPARPSMRVREGRSWEPPAEAGRDFASGWSQTWPVSSGEPAKAPWEQEGPRTRVQRPGPADRPRSSPSPARAEQPTDDAALLRDWLAEDDENAPGGRPRRDE